MSNVLEAISKLKIQNSKNHFSNLSYNCQLTAYDESRHMKIYSKQPVKQAAL